MLWILSGWVRLSHKCMGFFVKIFFKCAKSDDGGKLDNISGGGGFLENESDNNRDVQKLLFDWTWKEPNITKWLWIDRHQPWQVQEKVEEKQTGVLEMMPTQKRCHLRATALSWNFHLNRHPQLGLKFERAPPHLLKEKKKRRSKASIKVFQNIFWYKKWKSHNLNLSNLTTSSFFLRTRWPACNTQMWQQCIKQFILYKE